MMTPDQDDAHMEVIKQLILDQARGLQIAPIALGPYIAFLVVCALQVACRHPEVQPNIRAHWRLAGEEMTSTLPDGAQQLLALGWDPGQDVTVNR